MSASHPKRTSPSIVALRQLLTKSGRHVVPRYGLSQCKRLESPRIPQGDVEVVTSFCPSTIQIVLGSTGTSSSSAHSPSRRRPSGVISTPNPLRLPFAYSPSNSPPGLP